MSAGDCRIVVLISGGGTNLQALIDAAARGDIPGHIVGVISNRPDAGGLARAARAGIPTAVVDHAAYPDRARFDAALAERIDAWRPDLVCLAGFMRILTPEFVQHYAGRMLNIHPSRLPRFRGLDTHARALAAGETEHGASIHFVTAELDGGPVVLQSRVAVGAHHDPASLAADVLRTEHVIYPLAVRWFCQGRLRLAGEQVLFDGRPLTAPLQLDRLDPDELPRARSA